MKIYDTYGNVVEETTEEEEKQYDELFERLNSILEDEELGNLPFSVDLFDIGDDIRKELNEPFTDKEVIIIKDRRTQFWDENELPHYLTIKKKNNNPITLKQILLEMGNDTHYQTINTDHVFLEGFDTKNGYQYTTSFGS